MPYESLEVYLLRHKLTKGVDMAEWVDRFYGTKLVDAISMPCPTCAAPVGFICQKAGDFPFHFRRAYAYHFSQKKVKQP